MFESYLTAHRRQVPHAADNGPATHHPEQIIHHPKLTAVPEGIPKPRVILEKHKEMQMKYNTTITTMLTKNKVIFFFSPKSLFFFQLTHPNILKTRKHIVISKTCFQITLLELSLYGLYFFICLNV